MGDDGATAGQHLRELEREREREGDGPQPTWHRVAWWATLAVSTATPPLLSASSWLALVYVGCLASLLYLGWFGPWPSARQPRGPREPVTARSVGLTAAGLAVLGGCGWLWVARDNPWPYATVSALFCVVGFVLTHRAAREAVSPG